MTMIADGTGGATSFGIRYYPHQCSVFYIFQNKKWDWNYRQCNWNRKHYTSLTIRPRTTKFERIVTEGGLTLSTKARDLLTALLCKKKTPLLQTFRSPMATKLGRAVTQGGGLYSPSHRDFRPNGCVAIEKSYIWRNFIFTFPQNLLQPNLVGW